MKIGIDYTSAATQGAGIGRYTRELIHALLALPSDNSYSLFYASRKRIQHSAFSDQRSAISIQHLPFHDKWLMRLWHRLRIPIPVELVTGKIDLFHSPDFTLPPTLPGVPTLLTVHDLSFIRDPDSAWPSLRAFLNQAVPRSVKRATHVLADSQATRDDLIELFGTPADKITVLYSGVDARFAPVRDRSILDQVCVKYGITRPFILSVGTLQPRKNYARLIQAFAHLANDLPQQLIIAGGQGWLFGDIFTLVKSLGLENRVRFPGFVDDADLPALYSAADLFAYVSLYEGFGLPLLEAMACGTPVIGSNTSSLPEVIGAVGLQVDPRNVAAIANALKMMLTQSDLRARSMVAGIDRARLFTWEKAARELLSIYDRLDIETKRRRDRETER
jgi:glycosyltransferase involved in cell wall biosynthesis